MTFVPMQIDNNSTHIPYLMYIEAHELGFKMEGIVNFDASDSLVWSTRLNRDGSLYDVTAKKLAVPMENAFYKFDNKTHRCSELFPCLVSVDSWRQHAIYGQSYVRVHLQTKLPDGTYFGLNL